jgi:DNA-binding transcriptional ArsR family regulator
MSNVQPAMFAALADPTRMSIIDMLAKFGELSASDISSNFDSTASAISHHLKILREAGLVVMQKRAQKRIYHIDAVAMNGLEVWINTRTRQWNDRLDTLDEYVKHIK